MTPTELRLKIDSLAYGPYGIGRKEGKVIMVPLTAPGDEGEVRIVQEKGNYAIGELLHLVKPSPLRQPPPCPYFGKCGGCSWQQIQYNGQLAAKEKNILDALRRIGKLAGFEMLPTLRSTQEYHYRRRIRLQVNRDKKVGFYRTFSHELIEINSCLIAAPGVDRCLSQAREWIHELKTPLRQMEIIEGDIEGQILLTGKAVGQLNLEDIPTSAGFLDGHKQISGLILFGRDWHRSWGQGTISIRSGDGNWMEMDGDVFTQVNRDGNHALLRNLLEWGEFHEQDRVLELYCGAGNFTLPVACRAGEVMAVERNSRPIESVKRMSRLNRMKNIRWIRAHVPHAVKQLRRNSDRFSKILLDPPRSGAKELEEDLAPLGAEKVLYISCNPATLARDLAAWTRKGYKLTRIRPIDLFPQTYHVEALAEMVRE
ncbi:MAG: 23S rRNA (uracil(1939)-C(5))-methyltransferase RlmD [Candidatus Binatia bacterium]